MTTIIGFQSKRKITLISDGLTTVGGSATDQRTNKILTWSNGVAIGLSGTLRINNILSHTKEVMPTDSDPEELWQWIRSQAHDDGWDLCVKEDGDPPVWSQHFLFVMGSDLYHVDPSGYWRSAKSTGGFVAIGSGALEASAAYDMFKRIRGPESSILDGLIMSLDIAKTTDIYSGGQTQVVSRSINNSEFHREWIK